MTPDEYYRQMFEYYDGAKYEYKYDTLIAQPEPRSEFNGKAMRILEAAERALAGTEMLDIACGGGKWCRALAPTVKRAIGIDWSNHLLDVARKYTSASNVSYLQDDVLTLEKLQGTYSGACHFNFINHIPRVDWLRFIDALHSHLAPGSPVVMGAQRHSAKRKGELLKWTDELPDDLLSISTKVGKQYILIENEFDEVLIRLILQNRATDIQVEFIPPDDEQRRAGAWFASYRTKKA